MSSRAKEATKSDVSQFFNNRFCSELDLFWKFIEEGGEREETDEEMKARGAMDDDGFVVCEHCGAGGGAHPTEECPGLDEECPGNEEDYEFTECCDTGCKYNGHWYKK